MSDKRSLSGQTAERIRDDILAGRFVPGERLRLDRLSELYNVGSTPLREALASLAASADLVRAESQRGFYVAPISAADLIDLVKTRVWLDKIMLRASLRLGGNAWEGEIAGAAHRLARVEASHPNALDDRAAWEVEHRAFHRALVSAAGSRRMLEYHDSLYSLSDRYRRLKAVFGGPRPRSTAEHRAMADAALNRDTKTIETLIENHFVGTAEAVLSNITENSQELIVKLRADIAAGWE
jgi:DNA-binding GntR family transcriptional regulator